MVRHILIIGGIAIVILAVLDLMNVPLEFPTSCNTTNLLVGGGMVAAPFLYQKFV